MVLLPLLMVIVPVSRLVSVGILVVTGTVLVRGTVEVVEGSVVVTGVVVVAGIVIVVVAMIIVEEVVSVEYVTDIVSIPVFPAASRAVTVIILLPFLRVMSVTYHQPVPAGAVPEPPRLLNQVTWVTARLSEIAPPITIVPLPVV